MIIIEFLGHIAKQITFWKVSMAKTSWQRCDCPTCNRRLTSRDLAEIYFTSQCPVCGGHVGIDARRALAHAKSSKIIAIILTAIFVSADGLLLKFAGITEKVFESWTPALRLSLAFCVVMTGVASIILIQLISVKILLKITSNNLKAEGRLWTIKSHRDNLCCNTTWFWGRLYFSWHSMEISQMPLSWVILSTKTTWRD